MEIKVIMKSKVYRIKDKNDRVWGSFSAIDCDGVIHGYLNPDSNFDEVKNIFLIYERKLRSGEEDSSWVNIIDLGAYLIDDQNKRIDIVDNIIFVGSDFLVTCQI